MLAEQRFGSDTVRDLESQLEQKLPVNWLSVTPDAIASLYVRGVRALPNETRVFGDEKDFRNLRRALRSGDPAALSSVCAKLKPQKRELLQVWALF